MNGKTHQHLKSWSIAGVFVIFILAGLWHFLYTWLPGPLTAVLSPVNESPWEHTKLFFMPALIYFIIGRLTVGKEYPNFTFAHTAVLPLMPLLMLGIYTLLRAAGIKSLAADLVNTLIVIPFGVTLSYKLTLAVKPMTGLKYQAASLVILLALFIVFAVFTYSPPHIPIFLDSNTLRYGIPRVNAD